MPLICLVAFPGVWRWVVTFNLSGYTGAGRAVDGATLSLFALFLVSAYWIRPRALVVLIAAACAFALPRPAVSYLLPTLPFIALAQKHLHPPLRKLLLVCGTLLIVYNIAWVGSDGGIRLARQMATALQDAGVPEGARVLILPDDDITANVYAFGNYLPVTPWFPSWRWFWREEALSEALWHALESQPPDAVLLWQSWGDDAVVPAELQTWVESRYGEVAFADPYRLLLPR